MTFGPPLFHRVMRRVAEVPKVRRKSSGIMLAEQQQKKQKRKGSGGSQEAEAKAQAEEAEAEAQPAGRYQAVVIEESKGLAPDDDMPEPVTFKLMSYNILADMYVEERATHLPDDSMCRNSTYRRNRILAEIEQSNPDIICMQEVSYTDGTFKFFHDELVSLGYRVVYEEADLQTSEAVKETTKGKKTSPSKPKPAQGQEEGSKKAAVKPPRAFGILTAYKEEIFAIKQKVHLDLRRAGDDLPNPKEF